MTFPVLPPTFLRALPRPWAALEMAGPADEETRDRPSDAFEAAEEAASPALEAASEVEEAYLTADLRVRNCDCRSTARDAVAGILKTTGGYITLKGKNDSWKSQVEDKSVQWRYGQEPVTLNRRAIAGPELRFEVREVQGRASTSVSRESLLPCLSAITTSLLPTLNTRFSLNHPGNASGLYVVFSHSSTTNCLSVCSQRPG